MPRKRLTEEKGQESLQHHFKLHSRQVGDVSAMSSDGRGVIKSRGEVFFADHVVTGDRVAFTPDLTAKPPVADNPKVLKLSPHHRPHVCPHHDECRASVWGIMAYPQQLHEKTELVKRVLRGIVEDSLVAEMWPSPKVWSYRSRVTLQTRPRESGGADLGYATGARGAGLAVIWKCMLANEDLSHAIRTTGWVLRDARDLTPAMLPARINLFDTSNGPGGLAIFKGNHEETDVQHFLELARTIELPGGFCAAAGNQAGIVGDRGRFWREEECQAMRTNWLGHDLEVHPAAFSQVNQGPFDHVLSFLTDQREVYGAKTVWDLYGGFGALGFAVAKAGSAVRVVEQNGLSRGAFEQLAALRSDVTSEFRHGETARVLSAVWQSITSDDLAILDPPRSGCHPEVLVHLGSSKLRRLIYLSCNPARLSRDLKILANSGFRAVSVQPVDFFPQTPEIEALAVVER